jgi:hypothetical protein
MAKGEEKPVEKEDKPRSGEITFQCQRCQRFEQLEEMRVITRFFPVMVVCRQCEKELR